MTCTKESFLKDVKDHVVEVLRADGIYRHIRFRKLGTMCRHFDLITWPGYLCYTGDMGTYVFRRLDDMFQFFRGASMDQIDRRYWAEKLEGSDKYDGIKEFDEAKFDRAIKEYVLEWVRENTDCTTKAERRDLWDTVLDEVIGADGDSKGQRKSIAAYDFSHRVNGDTRFQFEDLFERTFDRYTFRFLWCCYALAWGIKQYDQLDTTTTEA